MQTLCSGAAEGYVDKWRACGQKVGKKCSPKRSPMAARTFWMQSKYKGEGSYAQQKRRCGYSLCSGQHEMTL